MDLEERWPLSGAEELRDRLLAAYAGSGRGYHDLRHLREVLDRLAELRSAGVGFDPLPVALAAWFHDAVYDSAPGAEERSARWAEQALAAAGVPAPQVLEVVRLVRLTVAHDPRPDDLDGSALCDADLAVLAAPPQRYQEYVDGVRREYAHVADEDFRAGRSAVLRALTDRPHLFSTTHARVHWEPAARRNVTRELQTLSPAPG